MPDCVIILPNNGKITGLLGQINGNLAPMEEDQDPLNGGLEASCDIESCAFRQNGWDGPILSCYCLDASGDWQLSSIDLSEYT